MHKRHYLGAMEQIRRTGTERVIWELGGQGFIAGQLGIHRNTVRAWEKNDRIPAKWQRPILDLAERVGARVTEKDLIG